MTLEKLTMTEYERAKSNAIKYIISKAGEQPTPEKLKRQESSIFGLEDFLSLIVFVASLAISSTHVIDRMGEMSEAIYHDVFDRGFAISKNLFISIHQVGYLMLAETSMILFMVRWRLWARNQNKQGLEKLTLLLNVDLILAIMAMTFILMVNFGSGLDVLEAFMPPLFTIGLGFSLEHLFVEWLDRKKKLKERLEKSYNEWYKQVNEPESVENYKNIESKFIWEEIAKKTKRSGKNPDVPGHVKLKAVRQEQERDNWVESETAYEEAGISEESRETGGLPSLYSWAKKSSKGKLESQGFWVNLDEMCWGIESGKTYGPYKKKGPLLSSMTMYMKSKN